MLNKYKPEDKKEKKARLQQEAENKAGSKDAKKGTKPYFVKYGINHVTTLVEEGKAKLVVIPHDVDPIELIVFLPALCRKKGVPFCFVKGKERLGKVVHLKTVTCLAITEVKKEDITDLEQLRKNFLKEYNEDTKLRREWGGGVMGIKNQHMMAHRKKIQEIEEMKKANM